MTKQETPLWIDTHCHLDAAIFQGNQAEILARARAQGVSHIVMPCVDAKHFASLKQLAHTLDHCSYALGIHPLFVPSSEEADLALLETFLAQNTDDDKLVAIGEIGLDYYLPELTVSPLREKLEYFFVTQLKLAKRFDLPVLLHTRRCVDDVLKLLRRHSIKQGIAHAFSGSVQQAKAFIGQGFKISFCGTATYERAQRQRTLLQTLSVTDMVVETDAPDLPPYWKNKGENSPTELPQIGEILASIVGMDSSAFAKQTAINAKAVLRLKNL